MGLKLKRLSHEIDPFTSVYATQNKSFWPIASRATQATTECGRKAQDPKHQITAQHRCLLDYNKIRKYVY